MKKKWLTIGVNAGEIKTIDNLFLKNEEISSYIHDFHFPHYDAGLIPSGRIPAPFNKEDVEEFIKKCKYNDINATLILNYGNYNIEDIKRVFETFYLPLGVNSVVVKDLELIKQIKEALPEVRIQGSCLSFIDTIDGLLEEASYGVELHNPAVWTIRDMDFIKEVNRRGLKQKQMMNEGCARKCRIEKWHRKEVSAGRQHSLEETCGRAFPDIYTFLMGSWVTLRQLKRMENYIDVLKLPRNTFDDISTDLNRFIELYDSGEPYNILEFVSTPLLAVKNENIIMSDIFDDAFFDNTVSDEVNKEFLEEYARKIEHIPFFQRAKKPKRILQS
ncbi:hypothetical protein ACSLGG_31085 (plasmid) [Bacillus mycoides]|uniref:hypothetical protein n=1 Tax=Bacillus mycoides TaxID=1405 RepID=UPI003F753977